MGVMKCLPFCLQMRAEKCVSGGLRRHWPTAILQTRHTSKTFLGRQGRERERKRKAFFESGFLQGGKLTAHNMCAFSAGCRTKSSSHTIEQETNSSKIARSLPFIFPILLAYWDFFSLWRAASVSDSIFSSPLIYKRHLIWTPANNLIKICSKYFLWWFDTKYSQQIQA